MVSLIYGNATGIDFDLIDQSTANTKKETCISHLAFDRIDNKQKESVQLETVIWRMLASLDMNEQENILSTVVEILYEKKVILPMKYLYTPLTNYSAKKLEGVLLFYGIRNTPSVQKLLQGGTLANLVALIASEKSEGLTAEQYYEAMKHILDLFLKDNHLKSGDQNLVQEFRKRVLYNLNELCEWNFLYYLAERSKKYPENPVFEKELHKAVCLFIKKQISRVHAYSGQTVGHLLRAGFPGHFINIEIKKQASEYYCYVANAGMGQNQFHHEVSPGHFQSINMYVVSSEKELFQLLEKLVYVRLQGKGKLDPVEDTKAFYACFKGVKRIVYEQLAARPPQTIGNCGLRNQEELFFWICQRNKKHYIATLFQAYIRDLCKEKMMMYPALVRAIRERGLIKPAIQPFYM